MHNARRLADQWRGFYNSCNQGEETKLNAKGDHVIPPTCPPTGPRPMRRIRQKGPLPMAPTNPSTVISDLSTENKVEDETVVADVFPLRVQQPDAGNEDPRVLRDRDIRTTAGLLRANPTLPASITAAQARKGAWLRTPSVSNGQYGRTKDLARQSPDPTVCTTPTTVSHRAQSPQSSKCEVLERLRRPAHRAQGPQSSKCEVLERLQRPVSQNHWQGSRGLKGLRGFKRPVWQKRLFFPFLRTSWP